MEKTDLDRAGFICHGLTVFFGQADNIALAADFQKIDASWFQCGWSIASLGVLGVAAH
ncbi:MAG: hypothetical protein WA417_12585 [Stellaceae bacterium]|jgi:hypothetical protein